MKTVRHKNPRARFLLNALGSKEFTNHFGDLISDLEPTPETISSLDSIGSEDIERIIQQLQDYLRPVAKKGIPDRMPASANIIHSSSPVSKLQRLIDQTDATGIEREHPAIGARILRRVSLAERADVLRKLKPSIARRIVREICASDRSKHSSF